MMPLCLADEGEELVIKRIGGSPEMKKHLEDMGFTVGSVISITSKLGENVIVRVRESRVAINNETARRIMV